MICSTSFCRFASIVAIITSITFIIQVKCAAMNPASDMNPFADDPAPSYSSTGTISGWKKVANCFKTRLGSQSVTEVDVRCAGREMVNVFDQMKTVSCKNCDLYFHCLANYNAVFNCGQKPRSISAAEAVEECHDFQEENDEREASRFGRSGGECAKRYLCTANCNYSPVSGTCSRVNCRK